MFYFYFIYVILTRLNHIHKHFFFHICITHFLLAHVYTGFCSDKHPIVAMVSAEVWEEDGSFLRYHSEYTVFILVGQSSFKHGLLHFDVYAILWAGLGVRHPCLNHGNTLEMYCFRSVLRLMTLSLYLVDHALHLDAGLHP